jgi:GNAT superfamily N-acetyltransferase
MATDLHIAFLADHPEALDELRRWLEEEWASYYRPPAPGDAASDLRAYSSRDRLPIGLVAYCNGTLCGLAALKPESLTDDPAQTPWAGALLVAAPYRNRGIATELLRAIEHLARELGFRTLFAGTSTAMALFEKNGWHHLSNIGRDGQDLRIFRKRV